MEVTWAENNLEYFSHIFFKQMEQLHVMNWVLYLERSVKIQQRVKYFGKMIEKHLAF